jgi:hypothetical protein
MFAETGPAEGVSLKPQEVLFNLRDAIFETW